MEKLHLKAIERDKRGKEESRRLRARGFVPAVLYGKDLKPLSLALQLKDLDEVLSTSAGMNAIITLDLEQGAEKKTKGFTVMVKEYQADILTRRLTHADLLKVDLKQEIEVMVRVHLTGKSQGVTRGGLIEHTKREIKVKCLPTNIPPQIEVDITSLDIGNSIHLNDLKLPQGVVAADEANISIVSIVAPAAEEPAAVPTVETATAEGAVAQAPGAVPASEQKTEVASKPEKAEKKS